jgi:hypothetical protein
MHTNLKKLDFIEIQTNELRARIDRMLGHKNTTIKIHKDHILIAIIKADVSKISKLSVPTKIGNLPVTAKLK